MKQNKDSKFARKARYLLQSAALGASLIASATGAAMITPITPNKKALDRKQNILERRLSFLAKTAANKS